MKTQLQMIAGMALAGARRALPLGEIHASVGLESFDNDVTGDTDDEWRVGLNWSSGF